MESIVSDKIKSTFRDIINYLDRINATDEDIEYIKEKEKDLINFFSVF